MQAIETIERDGFTASIYQDEDPSSPDDWDTLATLVQWHRDYCFGENVRDHPALERGGPRMLARYLTLCEGAKGLTPVSMLDHSGITLYAGAGPHWSDSAGWDSGQVGFIYTTDARLTELCGEDPKYHTEEWAREAVAGELETWNQYVTGDVYGIIVRDPDGNETDSSCWGFYGFDYAKEEAERMLTDDIEYAAKRRIEVARGWATAHGLR